MTVWVVRDKLNDLPKASGFSVTLKDRLDNRLQALQLKNTV